MDSGRGAVLPPVGQDPDAVAVPAGVQGRGAGHRRVLAVADAGRRPTIAVDSAIVSRRPVAAELVRRARQH